MEINWKKLFSHSVMVPVQTDQPLGASGRLVIDWRGIPLAVPYRFDEISPRQRMPIAKCWREKEHFLLKLVHPSKGTTVDYAVRCLFNPEKDGQPTERVFVFLEMAPGCPGGGDTVPVWTVVERLDSTAILTLAPDEIYDQQTFIEEIVDKGLTAPAEAIEATFGKMLPWENPDWGDQGNLHLVCVRCLGPLNEAGQMCLNCSALHRPWWKFWN